MYLFDHVEPGAGEWGSFHTSEVPYALGTLSHSPGRAFTAADTRISAQMSRYWINFVKHGDPNGEGLPSWRPYDNTAPSIMVLGSGSHMVPMLTPEKRAFYQDVLDHDLALTLF